MVNCAIPCHIYLSPLTACIIQLLQLILLVIYAHILPYFSNKLSYLFKQYLILLYFAILSAIPLPYRLPYIAIPLPYLLPYVGIPYYTCTFFAITFILFYYSSYIAQYYYMLPYFAILRQILAYKM